MRVLISQRDVQIPPSNFIYDALERGWYKLLANHTIITAANTMMVDTSIEFDCLVISGGPDSIERHLTENMLFAHAIQLNKPIIGVCHGAFTINDLTGGINGRINDHWMTDHNVIIDGTIEKVNSYHGQSIESLGDDMIPIATCANDNSIEAFQHKEKPIVGIVWHPERMENPVLPTLAKDILDGKYSA